MTYDVDAIRRQFPAASRMTYLDSGFQTPMCEPVREKLEEFIRTSYEAAGPKSEWIAQMEATRAKIAALINADVTEIAFTKNTSEAMNIAANALPLQADDSVLMLEGDHPNNAYAFMNLAKKGVETRFVPMPQIVNADTFAPHIDDSVRVISMSFVTFHAGHKFDVESVGRLCKERGLYFVVDVMQGIGVTPIDVKKFNATFVGSGTHKGLLVPQGLGFLYWDKSKTELEPAYMAAISLANPPSDFIARHGNMTLSSTAGRFEIGNFNLPAAMALGAALDLIASVGVEVIEAHCNALGDRLISGLENMGVKMVGPTERKYRAPHIYVAALPADEWVAKLAAHDIRVSPERDGIRISLAMFSTVADVDRVLDVIGATRRRSVA